MGGHIRSARRSGESGEPTFSVGEAAADIAVAAIETALAQRPAAGTHTPATAFGSGFIASVPGVTITYH